MVDRAESTARTQSNPEPESAEIVQARRRERRHQLKVIVGFAVIVAIVVGAMILNSVYRP